MRLRRERCSSSTNARFLRVELLSALGTPVELRDDPALRGISLLARPLAVTDRLAVAANSLFIEPALSTQSGSLDLVAVAEQLEGAWPGLVSYRSQARSAPSARCLALAELLASEPRQSLLTSLADDYPDDPLITAVIKAQVSAPTVAADLPNTALGYYQAGDFDGALAAAEAESPNRRSAAIALATAVNLGDAVSAARALTVIDRLEQPERDQMLAAAVERAFYEQLLSRTADAEVPEGWLSWLTGEWPDRPDLLADWASGWTLSPPTLASEAEALAGELLDALNDGRRARVRNALPVLISWLLGNSGLTPATVPLATTVLDIMLSSDPGRIERDASLVLLDEVLSVGCSSREYDELLESIASQTRLIGPRDAGWLAQCLDLLLLWTSPSPVKRGAVFSEYLGVVKSWVDRLDPTDVTVLTYVFRDAGLPLYLPTARDEKAAEVTPLRAFRSVGIYSLLEGAARVASGWIKEIWPAVEVGISSERVSSSSLASLARSLDVMLVQTSHAKHAATQAIDAAVLDSSRVVFVHGRGATALVRALLAWSQCETP